MPRICHNPHEKQDHKAVKPCKENNFFVELRHTSVEKFHTFRSKREKEAPTTKKSSPRGRLFHTQTLTIQTMQWRNTVFIVLVQRSRENADRAIAKNRYFAHTPETESAQVPPPAAGKAPERGNRRNRPENSPQGRKSLACNFFILKLEIMHYLCMRIPKSRATVRT